MVLVLTGILFSCKDNKDGYSDEVQTGQLPADTTTTVSDTAGVSGFSTTNSANANEAVGTEDGGTGTGIGPGESPNDGATDSGPSEKHSKDSINTSKTSKKTTKNK
ncbi:hypothetical protein SAMN06265346_12724 [Flavobacterium hercynium]|nr:hypothetical protein SAMN06265346_12724 [Flavobacterium hercynium]